MRSASIVSWERRPAPRRSQARARGGARPGTIWVSRPIASASSAGTMRPVRIRSSARPRPTMRGSRSVPPSISGTPQRRSGKPRVEPSAAILRSHRQRQLEPAREAPAGDRGDRGLRGGLAREAERAACHLPDAGRASSIAFRSAPAQKASSPAPVRISDARPVVGLEALEPLGEQVGGGTVDRVAALLAVDRQHRGGTAALVGHGLCGHPDCGPATSRRAGEAELPSSRPCACRGGPEWRCRGPRPR